MPITQEKPKLDCPVCGSRPAFIQRRREGDAYGYVVSDGGHAVANPCKRCHLLVEEVAYFLRRNRPALATVFHAVAGKLEGDADLQRYAFSAACGAEQLESKGGEA